MLRYLLKRLLLFIPMLFGISLLTFLLAVHVPGDPVKMRLRGTGTPKGASKAEGISEERYRSIRQRMGLDAPLFYLSLSDRTIPDTLYRIPQPTRREHLQRIAWEYGVWEHVAAFKKAREKLLDETRSLLKKRTSDPLIRTERTLKKLFKNHEEGALRQKVGRIRSSLSKASFPGASQELANRLAEAFQRMVRNPNKLNRYIPILHWHGFDNRYHTWVFGDRPWIGSSDPDKNYAGYGVIRGDLGHSYFDGRPVGRILIEAFGYSFLFGSIALLLVYSSSLLIGVFSSTHPHNPWGKSIRSILLFLYSMPEFWVGTLLITLLANPDMLDLFPVAFTLMDLPEDAFWWEKALTLLQHMVLPLFCFTYGAVAYVSRHMQGGMENVLHEDFMRHTRARGIPPSRRVWKHALRNALLPVITLFGTVLPYLLSGSVIIETIFSIPGLGRTGYEALMSRDHPVIFSMVLFTSMLTLTGTLLSDILYAWADPRIAYEKKGKG